MASDGTFQNLLLALLLCPALASSVRTLIVLLAAACSSGRACAELVALLLVHVRDGVLGRRRGVEKVLDRE